MFVGHFAVGLAAKQLAPSVSLGTLFLAVQFADLLWPTLVLAGIEVVEILPGATAVTPLDFVSYPSSHSLLALAGWGAALAIAYLALRGGGGAAGVVLAAGVVSHWVLDYVTHRPDMPLTLGGTSKVGLGLWRSVPATVALEMAMLAAGLGIYLHVTRARDRTGRISLWLLVGFLLAVNFANMLGPPPPSAAAVAWAAPGDVVARGVGVLDRPPSGAG